MPWEYHDGRLPARYTGGQRTSVNPQRARLKAPVALLGANMAIVYRLPTWNMEFEARVPDESTDTYSVHAFSGQLYTLKRVAEVIGDEAMYIVFPKEVDTVPNPLDIPVLDGGGTRYPMISHSWNGRVWNWTLFQLVPRWAGFPNEHYLGLLVQHSAAGAASIYDKSLVVDPDLSTALFDEASVAADGVEPAHFRITLKTAGGLPIPGRIAIPTNGTSGTVTYTPPLTDPLPVTDAGGVLVYEIRNTVAETVGQDGFAQPSTLIPGNTVDFV